MLKQKINVVLFLFFMSLAPAPAQAAEFKSSVGVGLQFGGLVGWQGSLHYGQNKFRGSFGLAGTAWGYDRYFGSHYSVGAQIFGNQFRIGGGLSVNYYLSQQLEPGFVFGLDLYRGASTDAAVVEVFTDVVFAGLLSSDSPFDAQIENGIFLSLGYQF